MIFENKNITILYGSQTGNAQDVAERIWRESKRYYFTGTVRSLDDYNVLQLVEEDCVIIVCSTTGQGEEPDNMKTFWKFLLRKNLPASCLNNLRYAVFGLGDSSYVKYNFVAKRLNKRLAQLGAEQVVPLGLGDDQHDLGYDAAVDPWIEALWTKLMLVYPLPAGISPLDRNSKIIPRWLVTTTRNTSSDSGTKLKELESIFHSSRRSDEFTITVKENRRTTHPDHFQDVRLISFRTPPAPYHPGDILVLRPRNLPSHILSFQRLLATHSHLNLHPTSTFSILARSQELPVPSQLRYQVTFGQLCGEYFDLAAVPRRGTFELLGQLTESELEKEKCEEFSRAEGQEELYKYCNRVRRNIVEVLEDFPHATKNITPEMLFELLTPIKPREFSIASSCSAGHEGQVDILVAVVKYKTKLVKERLGLCSNYLADLKPGDEISAWLKRGSFRFPEVCNNPVIMIGPGTGLAPFRNYINNQVERNTASKSNLLLFFGCRGKEKDFHCREELEELHNTGKLNLICAFSRDQEHKIYVQHKLLEHKELLWNAIKHNTAYIFVAGNSKNMPQGVRDAFLTVSQDCGLLSEAEAEKFIETMEKRNQYQTETWC